MTGGVRCCLPSLSRRERELSVDNASEHKYATLGKCLPNLGSWIGRLHAANPVDVLGGGLHVIEPSTGVLLANVDEFTRWPWETMRDKLAAFHYRL